MPFTEGYIIIEIKKKNRITSSPWKSVQLRGFWDICSSHTKNLQLCVAVNIILLWVFHNISIYQIIIYIIMYHTLLHMIVYYNYIIYVIYITSATHTMFYVNVEKKVHSERFLVHSQRCETITITTVNWRTFSLPQKRVIPHFPRHPPILEIFFFLSAARVA